MSSEETLSPRCVQTPLDVHIIQMIRSHIYFKCLFFSDQTATLKDSYYGRPSYYNKGSEVME